MVDVQIPEVEFNQNRLDKYFDTTKVGTLDVLGATLEDTFYYNPTNALDRFLQMQFGPGTTGNILSQEQYKESEYYREGLEAPEGGIKEGYAQLLAQNYDKRAAITQTLSRSKGGFGLGAAQFGTMLLGSVLDPINVASAFIPVFPAARYAHLVKNLGLTKARAVRGVVEGSVGATLVEPIVLGQAALEQDENYNLLDSFLNVTIGGVLGGGLHVGFGKLSDTIERRSQKTKEQAVLTAVKQTLTDQEVNVTPIIKADLEKTFEKNLEKQNNLAQEKPTRIEDVTRTGKGLPGSLRATKPKTLVQFMKENGGIRPDDPQVSDLRASLDKATFTVLNKKDGLSLDEMTIRVQEAGYFLDKSDLDYGIDGATPRDLLDLIDRESRGEVLYSRDQETQFRDYEKSQEDLKEQNIFHKAITEGKYESFLLEDTALPMMYMPDAIRATIELMEAPQEKVKIRSSYNLAGISFTPKQIANEIKKHIPNFEISYNPDFRQKIADSWPSSINDLQAKLDWGWNLEYNLEKMTKDMMMNLMKKYKINE